MIRKQKILVIEDEQDIREGLYSVLHQNYEVKMAEGGLTGLKLVIRENPDLILLDLNLPDFDGFQTCKAIRSDPEFNATPIVVLSVFNDSAHRLKAFEMGVDDYISKPFDVDELTVRIARKLVNQRNAENASHAKTTEVEHCGNLVMDLKNETLRIKDKEIELSDIEFALLRLFVKNFGVLLTRKKILEVVWQKQKVSERIMDPHIFSLRKKLVGFDRKISAIYGHGYILK